MRVGSYRNKAVAPFSPSEKNCIPTPEPDDKTSILFPAYEYVELFVKPNQEEPAEIIRILRKDVIPHWGGRDARTIPAR
jgi:hypothetical protein